MPARGEKYAIKKLWESGSHTSKTANVMYTIPEYPELEIWDPYQC